MTVDEQVKKTIEEHSLINRGDVLILGLSGGPDSMCLLNVLSQLRDELGFSLKAFHLNHMIREEADSDEAFVKEYCGGIGVPVYTARADVTALAKKDGKSVEAAGREERHRILRELCMAEEKNLPDGCSARAVLAHNADDQAETVLLRLIRGTGIHGLAAMEYMRKDGLIRPLLDVPRKDIEEYCREKGLRTLTDKTNLSEEYLRNRVRLSVLPMLEEINPSVKQGLIRLAANASMDDGYLSELAENWYRGHVKRSGEGPVLFVKDLKGLQDALFYRAVRLAFAEAGLEKDIEAVHIKALKRSVYAGIGNKTVEFPGGYAAYINHGEVVFKRCASTY
ncbi:MAG: tRNA lysidine(34) synthetase TilS [Firmicutes bacterium]|nr:tRNA lysidine(34) synthetase TilS [Bacillota bacterium]